MVVEWCADEALNKWRQRGGASIASKIKWGILSGANIGVKRVIPAIIAGERGVVVGIASRDVGRARWEGGSPASRRTQRKTRSVSG
jgi:hypothetical protein